MLTPSFNQGRFIGDCIASVRNQSYPRVEHIICDGGSSDETLDVLRASHEGVRWTSEPDGGQANALNKAFAQSGGGIIGWLNSDDAYFERHAIEDAVAIFTSRPSVDLVYGHAALVGADNELLHFMWTPRFSRALLRYANLIVQPTVFVRRSALEAGFINEEFNFTVDRELWLRLRAAERRFARVDRVIAIDRHHETRKVYTMQDVGARESEILRATYSLPDGPSRVVISKLSRVVARVCGIVLLRRARVQTAFQLRPVSMWALARRQLLTPRRFMPLLREPPDPSP